MSLHESPPWLYHLSDHVAQQLYAANTLAHIISWNNEATYKIESSGSVFITNHDHTLGFRIPPKQFIYLQTNRVLGFGIELQGNEMRATRDSSDTLE